jgi:hypothetical protein
MKIRLLTLALLMGLLAVSSGCGQKTPSAPESPLIKPSSPLSSEAIQSPLPAPAVRDVTPFQLDKPIPVGSTRVTGRGPAGVPIMLLDITFGGPLLSVGEIGQDGTFELTLEEPLPAEHRIGLAHGNLEGTGWQPSDFTSEFNGDEARSVPQIGFFFDTYMVR